MSKYLIVAPNWLGDMVMSQSLYRYLKILYPKCIIDVAATKCCCAIATFMPEINKTFELEFKHGKLELNKRRLESAYFKSVGYTNAIVLPNSWKSGLIPFLAKIKKRTGWLGEMRYGLLNDYRKLDKEKYQLMIERFCALAIPNGRNLIKELPYPKFITDANKANKVVSKYRLGKSKPVVALCCGAEFGPAKKWPSTYYAKLTLYLLNEGYQVILLGNSADVGTTNIITEKCGYHPNLFNLSGKSSLIEVVYLLKICQRVVSNDSGLMHIACALGVPTLVIYGSTSSNFTPPLSKLSRSVYLRNLKCRPCFKRECPLKHMDCMNKLLPEKIISEFEKLPISL